MGITKGLATSIVIGLMMLAAVACSTTEANPTPTEPAVSTVPTATPITPASEVVTGTVAYLQRIALTPDAVIVMKLLDVSRADAPAITLGEQTIESPGQVPVAFEIEYDPAEIDERFSYAVQAKILEGGELKFINTSRYQVITRGNPTHVDMVLEMVGTSGPSASPTPTPSEPEWVEAPAPIEVVEVVVSESEPYDYTLTVVSRLPKGSSCSKFGGYEIERKGTNILVSLTNLEIAPGRIVRCTRDLPVVVTEIPLGGEFDAGETYTVVVNEKVTNSFVARDSESGKMVVKTSPIESVELIILESFPPQYRLAVTSTLPMGSSCSRFDGYSVARRSANTIHVTVTHLEIAPGTLAACTADLPIVTTNVSLGSEFTSGETYTIIVNEEVTETFVAQ